jgi:hypothetical protein
MGWTGVLAGVLVTNMARSRHVQPQTVAAEAVVDGQGTTRQGQRQRLGPLPVRAVVRRRLAGLDPYVWPAPLVPTADLEHSPGRAQHAAAAVVRDPGGRRGGSLIRIGRFDVADEKDAVSGVDDAFGHVPILSRVN